MPSLVDLSHTIEDGMTTYPGIPGPVITDHLSRADSRGHYAPGVEFCLGRIDMVTNVGTYLDTPFHRYAEGHDLSEVPLEAVAGVPVVAVDAPGPAVDAAALPTRSLTGTAVIVRTGWDRHWRTDAYGAGGHPYLAQDAVDRLVEERPALVGIDSVNIDDTATGERPVHSGLLAAGIYVLEHLTNLAALDGDGWELFAVPVKVAGMGTFPVRAFARRP
jgi:kynurenine formamidase